MEHFKKTYNTDQYGHLGSTTRPWVCSQNRADARAHKMAEPLINDPLVNIAMNYLTITVWIDTIWLFNLAMENHHFS